MYRRLQRALLAAVVGPLALATGADAQSLSRDLRIITMDQSTHSGIDTAQTRVIATLDEYRAFFAGSNVPMPPQVRVDFATEDVLVAAMGMQRTGGYAIEITRVQLMTGGFTGGHAFVDVAETRPAPGTIVTMALTSPIHVVRVPKGAIAYHFRTVTAGAAFTSLDLNVHSPAFGTSERLVLEASGRAQLLRSSPTARYMPVDGTATAAELQAVTDAFANADVATLPGQIPDPRVFIVAPTAIELTSTVGSQTYTTTANLDYYTPYDARVRPLVDALRAISARLAGGGTFDAIHLRYSGGFAPWDDDITVASDGTCTYVRNARFSNPTFYYSGQASTAELDALKQAVASGDMASLPATIDDPALVMDVPSLTIVTTLSGTDHTTTIAEAGFYDTYEARISPVVAAARAIADRLVTNGARELTGQVRLRSWRLFLDGTEVPWSDPLAPVLYRGLGRTVTVKAYVRQTAGGGSYLELESVRGSTTVNLNLRSGPSTREAIITTLPRGTQVEVTTRSRDRAWYGVSANGQTGWVYGRYVRIGN